MKAPSKVCSGCGEDRPLTCYWKDKSKKDGHQSRCRTCSRQSYNEHRARAKGKEMPPDPEDKDSLQERAKAARVRNMKVRGRPR